MESNLCQTLNECTGYCLTNDEDGLDDDVDDDGGLLALLAVLPLGGGDRRVVGLAGDVVVLCGHERVGVHVGVRAVGVDLDDAAAADDVQVGADLVVAGDWRCGRRWVSLAFHFHHRFGAQYGNDMNDRTFANFL